LSPFFIKHHTVKTYGGLEVLLPAYSTTVLDGEELPAHSLGHLNSGRKSPRYPLNRGSYRIGLDAEEKK
jgi:hypothetical protein